MQRIQIFDPVCCFAARRPGTSRRGCAWQPTAANWPASHDHVRPPTGVGGCRCIQKLLCGSCNSRSTQNLHEPATCTPTCSFTAQTPSRSARRAQGRHAGWRRLQAAPVHTSPLCSTWRVCRCPLNSSGTKPVFHKGHNNRLCHALVCVGDRAQPCSLPLPCLPQTSCQAFLWPLPLPRQAATSANQACSHWAARRLR